MSPRILLHPSTSSNRGAWEEVDRAHPFSEARRLRDEFGWSTIAIGSEKKPVCHWKPFQSLRATDAELAAMFNKEEVTGLAVVLGHVSGDLVCRDFDNEEVYGGYNRWASTHPAMATILPTARTAGGYHVYLRDPGLKGTKFLEGGELRGNGGYVILPPSLHPTGVRYDWLIEPSGEIPLVTDSLSVFGGDVVAQRPDNSNEFAPRGTGGRGGPMGLCPHGGGWLGARTHLGTTGSHGGGGTMSLLSREEEAAIVQTVPTGERQRNRAVFFLALHLKSFNRSKPAESFRHIVWEWWRRALPFIRTKDFRVTWRDFVTAWNRIRGWLVSWSTVMSEAAKVQVPQFAIDRGYRSSLQRLIQVCHAAQSLWGEFPFPLSARKAAEAIGLRHSAAHEATRQLESEGVIQLEKKGTRGEHGEPSWWSYLPGAG